MLFVPQFRLRRNSERLLRPSDFRGGGGEGGGFLSQHVNKYERTLCGHAIRLDLNKLDSGDRQGVF